MRFRLDKAAHGLPRNHLLAAPLIIIFIFAGTASEVSAQASIYVESEGVESWVRERVRRARSGRRELVRLPLVRRSDGWGCICPYYYIGLSPANAGPELWIEPRFAREAQRPSKNMIVQAEGYFTGRRVRRDMRTGPEGPEEWIYSLWEFRVQRIRLLPENHDYYDEAAPENRVTLIRALYGRRRKTATGRAERK